MVYDSEIYKGRVITIIKEENEEFFLGYYVQTVWFPSLEKAKYFIDRLTANREMNSL